MFGSAKQGANAYATVGVETGVVAASPHKLILMLFEGAMIAIGNAQQHMKAGEIEPKGHAISKAIMIIDNGLRASLNKKVGGDIAASLDSLYAYMSQQLLMANLKNDPDKLEEVRGLLHDLKLSWEAIGGAAAPAVPAAPAAQAYDPLAPIPSHLAKA